MMHDILIKYHDEELPEIKKIKVGDWIDLRVSKDYELKKGDLAILDLGVSMQLPKNYEAIVVPRSSTPKNFGIMCANSFGVIDNSYNGNEDIWKFPAYAIRDTKIKKGSRICQFRIIANQDKLNFIKVDDLGNKNRGGIGSTGKE